MKAKVSVTQQHVVLEFEVENKTTKVEFTPDNATDLAIGLLRMSQVLRTASQLSDVDASGVNGGELSIPS